jgi:acetyl esterase/lipase
MRGIAAVLRLFFQRAMSTEEGARRRLHAPKGEPGPPERVRRSHDVTSRSVGGFTSYTLRPPGRRPDSALLYLHGGSYIDEAAKEHWELIGRLVTGAGCRAEVPAYGLAPRHTYRDALPFLAAVYEELLDEHDPSRIVLAGDSAGGGLALVLAQALVAEGGRLPGRLLLIAPWLDVTMGNPDSEDAARNDPWLTLVGLRLTGAAWAGDADPRDPRVSPLFGPMAGLPPVDAYIGTRDVFLPDTRKLVRLIAEAGGSADLHEVDGAVHVYPLTPTPEGRDAVRHMVATLRRT